MRSLLLARIAVLALFLLLTATILVVADQALSNEESPWVLFEILDHSVSFQDVSGDVVVYRGITSPVMLLDIFSGEAQQFDDQHPCGDFYVPDQARIEGDWLVVQFSCLDAGETRFQSRVYNLETGETFLLAPDPPDPALPYSWYANIKDARVVWSQLADCSSGDIYILDLETRDLTQVTDGPDGRAKVDLHLGPEWLVWDEINGAEDRVVSLRGANLVTSQTITLTQGQKALAYMPLAGNGSIVWTETISGDSQIWAYDLGSQSSYQISTSGPYPFAADLSGDLLLVAEEVDGLAGAPDDRQAGLPNEPCEIPRPYSSSKNRVRVYDLVSDSDVFLYYNPEARALYEARIDGDTAIWAEWAGQYPNEIDRVLAARRFEHQFHMPLVFH